MSRWKKGDTSPPLVLECFDGSRRPADFSDADLLQVAARRKGVEVWSKDITARPADGVIEIDITTETAQTGTFYLKAYAEWPDGRKQHYPPADQFVQMIVTD